VGRPPRPALTRAPARAFTGRRCQAGPGAPRRERRSWSPALKPGR
jgi:hypothetical protein